MALAGVCLPRWPGSSRLLLSACGSRSISARLERILVFAGKIAEGDFSARLSEYQNDEIGR